MNVFPSTKYSKFLFLILFFCTSSSGQTQYMYHVDYGLKVEQLTSIEFKNIIQTIYKVLTTLSFSEIIHKYDRVTWMSFESSGFRTQEELQVAYQQHVIGTMLYAIATISETIFTPNSSTQEVLKRRLELKDIRSLKFDPAYQDSVKELITKLMFCYFDEEGKILVHGDRFNEGNQAAIVVLVNFLNKHFSSTEVSDIIQRLGITKMDVSSKMKNKSLIKKYKNITHLASQDFNKEYRDSQFSKICNKARDNAFLISQIREKIYKKEARLIVDVLRQHKEFCRLSDVEWMVGDQPGEICHIVAQLNEIKDGKIPPRMKNVTILYGPRGSGKASLAKALAQQSNSIFIEEDAKNLGSASDVRRLLNKAKWATYNEDDFHSQQSSQDHKPQTVVLFVRNINLFSNSKKYEEQNKNNEILNELVTELKRFQQDVHNVIVIFTSPNLADIDGRIREIAKWIEIDRPFLRNCSELFKKLLTDQDIVEESADFAAHAYRAKLSYEDIYHVVQEAQKNCEGGRMSSRNIYEGIAELEAKQGS